jgi:hypothetical protein
MKIFKRIFDKFIVSEPPSLVEYKEQPVEAINHDDEIEYEIVEKEILPEKMICPDCGGITLVGLEFCDKCGGELMNQDN